MQTTWILVGDSSRARIIEQHGVNGALQEIEDFINPAGRTTGNEFAADHQGQFHGKGERFQQHAAEPAVAAHEHATELFAKSLTEYLEHANGEHRFHHLRLVAAPKFLGLIRASLGKELERAVSESLDREIASWSLAEIETYLRDRRETGGVPLGSAPAAA